MSDHKITTKASTGEILRVLVVVGVIFWFGCTHKPTPPEKKSVDTTPERKPIESPKPTPPLEHDHFTPPKADPQKLLATQRARAIEGALEADALASTWVALRTRLRNAVPRNFGRFVSRIKSIRTVDCPTDFREAYLRYCSACEGMQLQIQSEPQSLAEGFVTGVINALGGKPDGGLVQMEDGRRRRLEELRVTRREVDALAIRYGANKTSLWQQAEKLSSYTFPIVKAVEVNSQAQNLGIRIDDIYMQYDGVWLNEETRKRDVLYWAMDNARIQGKTVVEITFFRPDGFFTVTAPAGVKLGFTYGARD